MDPARLNKIWDRALRNAGGRLPRRGDAALASLLLVHGTIISGGIKHALETLTQQQYKEGVDSYRYFGLLGAAIVLERARTERITNNIELDQFTQDYETIVPNDSRLFHAAGVKLIESPEAFSPLEK